MHLRGAGFMRRRPAPPYASAYGMWELALGEICVLLSKMAHPPSPNVTVSIKPGGSPQCLLLAEIWKSIIYLVSITYLHGISVSLASTPRSSSSLCMSPSASMFQTNPPPLVVGYFMEPPDKPFTNGKYDQNQAEIYDRKRLNH